MAVSVPERDISVEEHVFSVTQSVTLFNEHTNYSHLSAISEDKTSGLIFYHNESTLRLQMDSEHPQTSTTLDSEDHSAAADSLFLLPDYDLSTINISKTSSLEGTTPDSSLDLTDGLNILPNNEEEAGAVSKEHNHSFSSVMSFFDSEGLDLSDRPTEASGSGSGLYSNRLNLEFDKVATIRSDLFLTLPNLTVSVKVDSGTEMAAEINNNTDDPRSTEGGRAEEMKGMEKNESELSGDKEKIRNQRVWEVDTEKDESARLLKSTAGLDMLEDNGRETTTTEDVTGKKANPLTSSWVEIESYFKVFSSPGDTSGSGGGSGDSEGKVEKVSDDTGDIRDVAENTSDHRNGIKVTIGIEYSNKRNGHDEEDQSLGGPVGSGNSTLKDNQVEGAKGTEDRDAAVIAETLQQFSSMELLVDAAHPALGRLVPELRLADEQKEGKCYTLLRFFSALSVINGEGSVFFF